MDVTNIYFMQDSANNVGTNSTTGKRYAVLNNAIALKEGRIRPADFPPIRVYEEGVPPYSKIWTLDHRRLIIFKLAGIDTINVVRVKKEEYEKDKFKLKTEIGGERITLLSSNGSKPIIVKRNERYKWTIETLKKNKDKF